MRYAWFDYALRGAERPVLLGANVNYEVAGANEWRHEDSLDELGSQRSTNVQVNPHARFVHWVRQPVRPGCGENVSERVTAGK